VLELNKVKKSVCFPRRMIIYSELLIKVVGGRKAGSGMSINTFSFDRRIDTHNLRSGSNFSN
jgi:hypothetical protein